MTKLMLIMMLSAGAADVVSTEYALSQGIEELNPFMQNRAVRIGTNIAYPVAMYFLLKDKPRAAKWFTIIYVGAKSGVIGRNIYIGATIRW